MQVILFQKVGKCYHCSGTFITTQISSVILNDLTPPDLRYVKVNRDFVCCFHYFCVFGQLQLLGQMNDRAHPNPIHLCHLATAHTHVLGMN